jgi:hypothetical protein
MGESVITYLEGHDTRVLRGTVEDLANGWIRVKRRAGDIEINRAYIIKIETPNEGVVL